MKNDIQFKKIERVCGYNEDIKAKGKGRLIYDFQVWVNGEHRANWCPRYGGHGYELRTPDRREAITHEAGSWRLPVVAKFQSKLLEVIEGLLEAGKLPTTAQLDQLTREREAKELEEKRQEEERLRLHYIKEAGPALLDALAAVLIYCATLDIEFTKDLAKQVNAAINSATVQPKQVVEE